MLSNLIPGVPSLLNPTNPVHKVTFLQNVFIGPFLIYLARLVESVIDIFGESVIYFVTRYHTDLYKLYVIQRRQQLLQ